MGQDDPQACHPYVRRHAETQVTRTNGEIAKQNTQPQSIVRMASPTGREQRTNYGADAAGPEQQTHAQHGAPLWIDSAQVHVEILVSHDSKENPTGADHELPRLANHPAHKPPDLPT